MIPEVAVLTKETNTGEFVIRRDARGVPFIDATNEKDLFFAQGYATASDRLWQMDSLRRTARGELAEVLGANVVEIDKLHRIYGFRVLAEKLLAGASQQTREALESYARGVNAFIEQCDGQLPIEFQVLRYQPKPWTPVDSLALGKLFAEKLSFTVDADIFRALLSDLPRERVEQLLPQSSPLDLLAERYRSYETGSFSREQRGLLTEVLKSIHRSRAATNGDSEIGSNSWVVSGAKTVSGKPLLASDPHLPPTSPSIWHIAHLSAGDFRVSGVAVPGVPGVMIGHNQWIAWGITNLCPDVQDLYFEEFEPGDSDLYKTPAGWRAADTRMEEIAVRNVSDGSPGQTVQIEVKVTRHGPVIVEKGSLGLALRWTALDTDIIDLDTFLAINRAHNWDEFTAALSGYGGPPQNFTYADTAGHIGCYSAGRIPVRKSGDGSLPYDGATNDGEWLGYIPFADMPHAFDPPAAQIVSANQRIVNDSYPYHFTHNWRVPYRARRINDLLQKKTKFAIDDFLAIQGDTYSIPDALFAAELVKLGRSFADTSTEWHDLVALLEGWDGYANLESTVLPVVTEMRKAFRLHILTAAIGAELAELYEWRNEGTLIDKLITERPLDWLPREFVSYDALLLTCYREAVDALTNELGEVREQWTWGRLAQVRFPHPLEKLGPAGERFATRTLPQNTGGSMPTVNAGARVSLRFIADLSDWDATRLCLPLGESGDPASAHREDQLAEWYNVTPSVVPFSEAAIAEANCAVQFLGLKQ